MAQNNLYIGTVTLNKRFFLTVKIFAEYLAYKNGNR